MDEWLAELCAAGGACRPFPVPPSGCAPRVLVIAPHPDDFDIVACTLLALAKAGAVLSCAVLSCGSGVEDAYCEERGVAPTPENICEIRRAEQRAGCAIWNEACPNGLPDTSLAFLELDESGGDLADRGQVLPTEANADRFCAYFAAQAPDLVFVPCVFEEWPLPPSPPEPMPNGAGNLGHYRAAALIEEALRRSGRKCAVLLHRDPKTVSMHEMRHTGYDEALLKWKSRMLRAHDSQHARNMRTRGVGFAERLMAPEREKARELGLGVAAAEVFQVVGANLDRRTGVVYRQPPSAAEKERERREQEQYYGQPVPKAVVAERPAWLPVNKYLHEGKEVVKISGSAVYGWRSTIHYADGSIQTQSNSDESTYSQRDDLIKQFGFIKYKSKEHDRYYGGERFEAVPVEDPSEWEEFDTPQARTTVSHSGWRRKADP